MREILHKILTHPIGFKIVCTLTFIPVMIGLALGIRWFVSTFGTSISLAVLVPWILLCYLIGRFFERY